MNKYEISIFEDIATDNFETVNKYWEIEDGNFKNKPSGICLTYDLSQYQLNEIVVNNSVCIIYFGYCYDCEKEIRREVTSQTGFKSEMKSTHQRCKRCEKEYQRKIWKEWEESLELQEKVKKERVTNLENFDELNKLSDVEKKTLREIVKLKERNLIFSKVFKFDYEGTWSIVNKLEKRFLLYVERNNDGRVVDFHFDSDLEQFFSDDVSDVNQNVNDISFLDSYTFNIPLVQSDFQTAKSPKYSKGFKLPVDVVFEKNTEYLVGCWTLTDGSLNITFTPKNKIFRSNDFILSNEENERLADETFLTLNDNRPF